MEDGLTQVEIVAIWKQTEWSRLVQLRRQVLPNGKKIPSGYKVWIPNNRTHGVDDVLKTMIIENDFINKLRFD
jgi:hypothetical protein